MKNFASRRTEGRGQESWQVIYMDLMTMVMVFFVILWSLNQGRDVGISETVGDTTTNLINLPGDVLFAPGETSITDEGQKVFKKLFSDEGGNVLSFESSGIVKRMLFVHGHTDSDGRKDQNIDLGYQRAYSAYKEILRYSKELPDHVVICTHADNTPHQEVPEFTGNLTSVQRQAVRAAKKSNRRITIEDKTVNRYKSE